MKKKAARTIVAALLLATAACSSSGNAGSPSDASDDAGGSADASGTLRCSASLSSVCENPGSYDCPPSSASALPGPWCATNPRAGSILGACDGYTVLAEGAGVDTTLFFMYAADSGALTAVVFLVNEVAFSCVGGDPSFAIPLSCFGELESLSGFTGPGAAPGCSGFDAGLPNDAGEASD